MTVALASSPSSIASVVDDDGQGLAEYALILALIAIVAIVALIFLGSQISDKLSIIGSHARIGRTVAAHSSSSPRPVGRPAGRSGHGRRRAIVRDSATLQDHLAPRADFLPFPPNGPSPLV